MEPLTRSKLLCSIFMFSALHLNFVFSFFFFAKLKWKNEKNNLMLVKCHCCCLVCHLMTVDFF